MRPKGRVRLFANGQLIWERDNIFVNAGLPALANLVAGVTAGQFVTAIGFGSSGSAVTPVDVGLNGTPSYYNAIGAHTFPSSGSVQFSYALTTTDYAANGITIQELGLFANTSGIALPAAQGTGNPSWAANTAEIIGNLIIDSNGNIERCTTAGTTGANAPTWASNLGGTTADGSAVWTLTALHQTPGPMIAHVTVPAFAYTGTGNYSGTWTLTF
jgi:hypothetical protein